MHILIIIFFIFVSNNLYAQEINVKPVLSLNNSWRIEIDNDLRFRMGNGYLPNYDFKRILDLSGNWKFEIGDDSTWADPNLNDTRWEEIYIPSAWEDEGFPGYDGYAWYRVHFKIELKYQHNRIYLYLGYIDDVDEVYLNGHLVGFTGSFPPDVVMADYMLRRYLLPPEYINFTRQNVLAVRVYDHYLAGGILRGKIGLYVIRNELLPDVTLAGYWKFKIGDNIGWKEKDLNDEGWDQILVPEHWETQGYRTYDGFAWYRKKFNIQTKLKNEKLILLLGRVDDLDETYLNGHLIGRTGNVIKDPISIKLDDFWRELRAYYIPKNYLYDDKENVIAVRVYDGRVKGGIYDGSIGIVTRKRYVEWKDEGIDKLFKRFIEFIFGD